MKSVIKSFIILLATGVMSSCSESFLELTKPIKPSSETYYTDTATAYTGLVGCYNSLQQVPRVEAPTNLFFILDIRSDDTDYGGNRLGESLEDNYYRAVGFSNFDIFSDLSHASEMWLYGFRGINTVNLYLEGVSKLTLTPTQQLLINQYNAEAKFLRAFFYFHLVKNYGGVPLITKAVEPANWLTLRRASENEIYSQIFSDLREAIPSLPLKSGYTLTQTNRITKGAAQALLAKALITNAEINALSPNWTEAYTLCDDIEKSSQYDLNTNVKDIFSVAGQFATEHVFDIVYDQAINGENDAYIHYLSPRYIYKNGTITDAEKMTYGFGVSCITEECANQYISDINVVSPGNYTFSYYNQNNTDTMKYINMLDQRGRYTFWSRFEKYCGVVYVADKLTQRNETKHVGRTDDGNYAGRKYNREALATAGYSIAGSNFHVIRFAEVLLLKAEAAYYKSDETEALRLVNLVRERAFRQAIAAGRVTLDQIKRTSTGSAVLEDIWQERRLEMAGETDRFYDLKRTHRLDLLKIKKPEIMFQTGKHELLPIPSSELSKAAFLTQNPNY